MNAEMLACPLEEYIQDPKKWEEYFENLQDWSGVPSINDIPLDSLTDGCLARFQGMVQDVFNAEFYYAKYKVKNKKTGAETLRCGRMRDLLHCHESEELNPDDENQNVRYPLFCIPIPGLNDWAKKTSRPLTTMPLEASSSGQKRSLDEDECMEVEETKKTKPEVSATPNNCTSLEYNSDGYFPLKEKGGLACIVKHYGEYEDFLVNTRIEAVGYLSLNPALEATWNNCDAEDKALHPPPSLVPRLHAILVRKLSHCNPTLPFTIKNFEMNAATIRSDLHTALTQILFGDTLAAEYLICNLLSTVYVRKEGLALGALSVNIYNIPNVPDFPQLLYEFLKTILPNNVYLPLTIDLLNTLPFVPRRDNEASKLLSGSLQLPDDTHLLVDETKMTAGMLQERGVHNMAALHSLTLRQELRYDFTYFQLPFHTNMPVVVLSEGKSMIPTDAAVKLKPEADAITGIGETFEAARFFMSGSRLEAVRKYLSSFRLRECDMTSTNFVGPAWAELRQQHTHLKQDDLHRLLVISRLLTLSHGRVILTKDTWDRAVTMEVERQLRSRS